MFQEVNTDVSLNSQSEGNTCNGKIANLTLPYKITRNDSTNSVKTDLSSYQIRDDFSVFGEYVANELRSIRGEKNQLIAKKKILDTIFEVKMGTCGQELCTVYSSSPRHISNNIHSDKVFTTPLTTAQIEPITHPTQASSMGEIIINGACSYSNFKVDTQ